MRTITLSNRDWDSFMAVLDNPPEPNDELKKLRSRRQPVAVEIVHQTAWVCSNCGQYAVGPQCCCGWVPPIIVPDDDPPDTELYAPEVGGSD